MRTLQDNAANPERKTALVARVLLQHNIDFAALSETRFADESQLTEVGAGYTFYWIGKPESEARQAGVGFAVRNRLIPQLVSIPKGINDRLMTMRLKLAHGRYATVISVYAPTMSYPDEAKEEFYDTLSRTIASVPQCDKLILLGDFNARVGRDVHSWEKVLGHQGVGKENSNGSLLLNLCANNGLIITNTVYQQANKLKTT